MKEDGDIASYFLRVDEIVNAMKGLGEEIKETIIVKKILRSLPMRFDPRIQRRRINQKSNPKPNCSCNDDSDEEEEMANSIRKLKKGTNKSRGKFSFKCFNCGKIGHFDDKCPYDENKENDE
jgi:hypothetical protein